MAALFSTGLETTPSSDLRGAGSSPREVGIRLVAMGLATTVLLLLAGSILLRTVSWLQPSEAVPSAWPEAGNARQVWRASAIGAAKLPREWTWEKQDIRFDTMFRKPR